MALDPVELTAGLAIGTGLGGGIADVVEPRLRQFKNEQSKKYPHIVPGAGTLAAGVAQGQVDPKQAATWAAIHGFDGPAFNTLIDIANVGPGSAYAFELWRRGQIDEAGFRRAVKRLGLEQEWIDDLVQIKQTLLTAEQLAVMIQRNVVDGGKILPHQPPTGNADVPPMPQVGIDPVKEAAGMGIDLERLSAMARIIGLPASPDLAARMHFRKIINEDSFNLAIKEGNTRGEWAPYLLEGFRQIPTAEQFVEAHLRGWIDKQTMYAGTARHGMSQPDTDLEFQIHRRSLTPHQVKQALARGASFNPAQGELQDPYEASVHQNNLGPEWYEMAIALQGSYPSLFITNRLVTSGIITADDGRDWLTKAGDADAVVTAMHKSWTATSTAAVVDPYVKKAQNSLWTEAHKTYVKTGLSRAQIGPAFTALKIPATAQQEIFTLWDVEKQLAADIPPA